MGKLFLLGLLMVVGALGLAVDFTLLAKNHPEGGYALSDHLAVRAGTLKTAVADLSNNGDVLPAAPDGWTHRPAVYEDSIRAYGVETSASEIQAGKMLEKSVLDALPGHRRYYGTYERGAEIVVIDITVVPPGEETRAGRDMMGTIFRRLGGGAEPYTSVGGVDLGSVRTHATGTGRLILGQIDGLAFISAASNAGDAETRALLEGIDIPALRRMVAEAEAVGPASSGRAGSGAGGSASAGECVIRGAGKFCTVGN